MSEHAKQIHCCNVHWASKHVRVGHTALALATMPDQWPEQNKLENAILRLAAL